MAALVVAAGVGAGAVSASSEPVPWFYDLNGDGQWDTIGLDRWNDGVADVECLDAEWNGVLERCDLDLNNDRVNDLLAADTNQTGVTESVMLDSNYDGYWDISLVDLNENGVENSQETGFTQGGTVFVVGPPTEPGWFYTFMNFMAERTGQATFGTPDSDGDGFCDYEDLYPNDFYDH